MVKNVELFKKCMMFSRQLRMSGINAAVQKSGEAGKDMPPMAAMMMKRRMAMAGMQEGEMPTMPPFEGEMPKHPPFGRRPGKGRGMSREHLLVIIGEHPEGVWQKDLAEEAGINASSASEVITKLEEDGYLTRTSDESDKRAVRLTLTEAGKERADEIRAEREAFLDEVFSKLTEEEKQTLSDLLDKLMS